MCLLLSAAGNYMISREAWKVERDINPGDHTITKELFAAIFEDSI